MASLTFNPYPTVTPSPEETAAVAAQAAAARKASARHHLERQGVIAPGTAFTLTSITPNSDGTVTVVYTVP